MEELTNILIGLVLLLGLLVLVFGKVPSAVGDAISAIMGLINSFVMWLLNKLFGGILSYIS